MNRILVAIMAALLLLATAGGATAGSLVTSKQIKNGTIKAADLSKPLRKTATAPAAAPGFTRIQRVMSTADEPSWARCPAGTTLTGGGAVNNANAALVASHPVENAWYARSSNFNDQTRTWALCAS